MTEQANLAVSGIIAELGQILVFSRTSWQRFAAEVEPQLTSGDVMLLSTISRSQPIAARELTALMRIDKAAASRSLRKLRELDLVAAKASDADQRVQLLTTTAHADKQLGEIRSRWAQAYRERFTDWDADSLAALRDGLHRFNESAVAE